MPVSFRFKPVLNILPKPVGEAGQHRFEKTGNEVGAGGSLCSELSDDRPQPRFSRHSPESLAAADNLGLK
jgi:hypothetical protein